MDALRIKQRWLSGSRRGISLIEIMVVMVIMAIVAGISLAAYVGAFTRGREANTRALISKVDRALNDHLSQWISRTQPGGPNVQVLDSDLRLAGQDTERAQVIARKRLYKEEFPQFFFVFDTDSLNPVFLGDWDPVDVDANGSIDPPPALPAFSDQQFAELSGAAREYRKIILDTHRQEIAEGRRGLANHDPATASAECLYMILLRAARSGSTESDPENFPLREVKDTDGDGLPELVDGWGNPLRFYRTPIFYDAPGVQKGAAIYTLQETREEDQYDPNRTLLLGNWANLLTFEGAISTRASVVPPRSPLAFHMLTDPIIDGGVPPQAAWNWDWDGAPPGQIITYPQVARAYKAQPLIVSAGFDEQFGIYPPPDWMRDPTSGFLTTTGERQLAAGAPRITPRFLSLPFFTNIIGLIPMNSALQGELQLELDKHLDNITNHELRAD